MSISFKLPDLDQNPILLAETRSSKIKNFIQELPFSDPVRAASDLTEELQILNSQKVSFSNRLNALELYRPAAIQATEALIPLFSYATLPMSRNQKAFADTVAELWQEVAFGYKWALIDLQNKIININGDKSTALVVQRAIHALAETAFVSYLTYKTPPKSFWSDLHQLYFCALQQKAQAIVVGADTVNLAYTQALLLALAHPQRLSSQDIVKAKLYIEKIAQEAELRSISFVQSSAGVFLVKLNTDEPPTAYSKKRKEPNSATDLLLISTKVDKQIHTHLKLLKEGILPNDGSMPSNALEDNYEDLLAHLITHFGRPPLREFSRAKQNDGMELAIGIHDAHYFAPKLGSDYNNLVVQSSSIKPSRWQILNASAGGFALRKFNSSQVTMQVGDIAAIKNNTTLTWEIGIIRWVSFNDLNQMDIGFELISPSAKAISLKAEGNNFEIKALLLSELSALKQQSCIIAPRGRFKAGTTIGMIDDSNKSNIQLTKLIERTQSFERFQYALI